MRGRVGKWLSYLFTGFTTILFLFSDMSTIAFVPKHHVLPPHLSTSKKPSQNHVIRNYNNNVLSSAAFINPFQYPHHHPTNQYRRQDIDDHREELLQPSCVNIWGNSIPPFSQPLLAPVTIGLPDQSSNQQQQQQQPSPQQQQQQQQQQQAHDDLLKATTSTTFTAVTPSQAASPWSVFHSLPPSPLPLATVPETTTATTNKDITSIVAPTTTATTTASSLRSGRRRRCRTDRGGFPHTQESRRKISVANKGKLPWNTGKHHTEEMKQKIAAGVQKAVRKKLLQKLATMGITEEEYKRQKEEAARKRAERLRKRRTAQGGYRHSNETKAYLSQMMISKIDSGERKLPNRKKTTQHRFEKGHCHKEESKKKIAESMRKRWAEPGYREMMLFRLSKANEKGGRSKGAETLKKRWTDPAFRAKMIEAFRTRHKTPEEKAYHRKKVSDAIKLKWKDPEYRNKMIVSLAKARAIKMEEFEKNSDARRERAAKKKQAQREARAKAAAAKKLQRKKEKPKRIRKKMHRDEKTKAMDKENQPLGIDRLQRERPDLYAFLYGCDDPDGSYNDVSLGNLAKLLDGDDMDLDNFDPFGLEE